MPSKKERIKVMRKIVPESQRIGSWGKKIKELFDACFLPPFVQSLLKTLRTGKG